MTDWTQAGYIDVPPDEDSAWWWAAVGDERLLLPRCDSCERCFFPPQPTCPRCGSSSWQPVEASGRGRVYSWIVIHTALNPAFAGDVPYTILAVTLDEGVRIFGRLTDASPVVADDPVEACFYTVTGHPMLGFRLDR
jgi:uncharacterized OB-fold protein